jgi:hypothetical protein
MYRLLLLLLCSVCYVSTTAAGEVDATDRPDDGGGLAAHYYKDPLNWGGNWTADQPPTVSAAGWTFSEYAYTRVEPLVNHLFIRTGWFSVRWLGSLETHVGKGPRESEASTYTFEIWADDGCRLVIDGRTVIDSWVPCSENSPDSLRTATVRLSPGKHSIKIEYFQGISLARADKDPIKVYWRCPERRIPRQTIPAAHFSHTPDDLQVTLGRTD